MNHNPLGTKAIQSFSIALKMSKLQKLQLSFTELPQDLEKELVELMCESFSTNCVVSLGTMSAKITTMAQVKYGDYLREQKLNERKQKNEKVTAVNEWENQLKSSPLARFLRNKSVPEM